MGTSQNQRNEGFNHSLDQKFGDQRGIGRGCRKDSRRGGFRGTYFHYKKEGHGAYECPQCQGRVDRRADGKERVSHVDDDAMSLYLEDAERREVLVN